MVKVAALRSRLGVKVMAVLIETGREDCLGDPERTGPLLGDTSLPSFCETLERKIHLPLASSANTWGGQQGTAFVVMAIVVWK
jgi:hypothetical protein